MGFLIFAAVVALAVTSSATAGFSPAYVCSACSIVLGLVEQAAFQIRLENYLKAQCDGSRICEASVHQLILATEKNVNPDESCLSLGVCPGEKILLIKINCSL